MMGRLGWVGLGALALGVVVGACEFPTFGYRPEQASGGTGHTSSGGTGGSAGETSGGGGGGGGGSGGGGGCGPQHQVCGPAEKCSVVDQATGARGCVEFGPRPAWAKCFDDAECGFDLWCDVSFTGVCKPVCDTGNDCELGAQCLPATDAGGYPIPGLEVCTAHCAPNTAAPCTQAFGPTNCLYAVGGEFDCFASIVANAEGQPCDSALECAAGLLCVGQTSGVCRAWCTNLDDWCVFLDTVCSHLTPVVTYDGTEYGACL